MYAMIFENRMYRVVLDISDLTTISDGSRISKIVDQAAMVLDLQTRKIHHYVGDASVRSITTSNPLYSIFVNLPLITFADLRKREPMLFL